MMVIFQISAEKKAVNENQLVYLSAILLEFNDYSILGQVNYKRGIACVALAKIRYIESE